MTKGQLLDQFTKDKEQRAFFASALDKDDQAQQRHQAMATGFFSPEEQVQFQQLLHKSGGSLCQWTGGFQGSERQIAVFLPPWQEEIEDSPLTVIEASTKGEVSHRDVLGSLMALGITRRKLGDILLQGQCCQVIALAEMGEILLSQWSSVGRYPVSVVEKPLEELCVPEQGKKEITSTVASLRLDSLVATGFSLGRSKASQLIAGGKVTVNHALCQKPDRILSEGDLMTCRGYGKCRVLLVKGESKKGRMIVTLEKYV